MSFGAAKTVKPNTAAAPIKLAFQTAASDKSLADIIDAAIWKLDRCSNDQLQAIQSAMSGGVAAGVRYADSLELDPIATGSASVSLSGKGRLANPAKTGTLIKFPEPLIGLLVWFDMRKELGTGFPTSYPRCDTVVHVFFDGDDLKWVRYFSDDRPSIRPLHTDDFEDCMFVGWWSSHTDATAALMPRSFYTTEFDDRGAFSTSTTDQTIIGKDIGYCQIGISDCLPWLPHAYMFREKRFSRETKTVITQGQTMSNGVAIPFGDREAYYYSLFTRNEGIITTHSMGYQELLDPWSYRTFRPFGGYTVRNIGHPDGCATPALPSRTVMLPAHMNPNCEFPAADINGPSSGAGVYTSTLCSDFADSGQWSSLCDNADARVYYIPPPPGFNTTTVTPPTGHVQVWLVSSAEPKVLKTYDKSDLYAGLWPLRSPFDGDMDGSADQWAGTTSNAYGDADSMIYSTNLNEASKVRGVPHYPEMDLGGVNYVGVIDG